MQHEVKVVARTFETELTSNTDKMNEELTLLAGKAAGVCYMPDDYMESGIQDEEKALARAEQTSKSGHHSVYDHGHLTLVVKTNKMMCMILNSLGVYATSEKSARYTKMQPETELELQMYEKWKTKIQELILAKYPDTDDVMLSTRLCKKLDCSKIQIVRDGKLYINDLGMQILNSDERLLEASNILDELKKSDTLPSYKLAQENARYMISVFTPTTMMHTISFRQAFLIIDYLTKLLANLDNANDTFSKKLITSVIKLRDSLEDAVGEPRIHDNKNQYIRFLEAQHTGELVKENKPGMSFKPYTDINERLKDKKEVIGDSYTLVYNGSLAMLAQAQRHRTIRYSMKLQEAGDYGFYTPEIVKDAKLEEEWQRDMKSVAYCIPQGTMVRITEQGLFEDFALKCKERMCGRAQLEIMKSTTENVKKFISSKENLSYDNQKLLENITAPDEKLSNALSPCARCQFKDFKCSEGCQWGPKGALTRLV